MPAKTLPKTLVEESTDEEYIQEAEMDAFFRTLTSDYELSLPMADWDD